MGCVRRRRGTWVVDTRIHGRRVVKAFRTRRLADDALAKVTAERRTETHPAVDPFVTLSAYTPRFLADCRDAEVVAGTLRRYERTLQNHVLPVLGQKKLRDITRSDIRGFLLSKRQDGSSLQGQKGLDRTPRGVLARNTVAQIRSVLSAVLSLAVEDEVLGSNPALGVFRERRTKAAKLRARAIVGTDVKAMDRDQRNRFLSAAVRDEPDAYVAFMLMGLGGLRLGEALGMKWNSVDLEARQIRVHEQIGSSTTKTGAERTVDLATPLAQLLRSTLARRREQSMAAGQAGALSPWIVFPWLEERPSPQQQQKAEKQIRRSMERVLKIAKLPAHFTPHSLRHTFCSLLIAQGISPVYVQQQAGHASVQMTVGVYGSWFPVRVPGAMDLMAAGLDVVAEGAKAVTPGPPTPEQPLAPTGTCGRAPLSRPSPG